MFNFFDGFGHLILEGRDDSLKRMPVNALWNKITRSRMQSSEDLTMEKEVEVAARLTMSSVNGERSSAFVFSSYFPFLL